MGSLKIAEKTCDIPGWFFRRALRKSDRALNYCSRSSSGERIFWGEKVDKGNTKM